MEKATQRLKILSAGWSLATGSLLLVSLASLLHAQDTPDIIVDNDHTPYHLALLAYKSGRYADARNSIDAAEKAKPGDIPTQMLKARILIEQGDFEAAKKTLEDLNGNPGLTGDYNNERTLAFGDLNLRKHSFFEAAKFYQSLLASKPNDPDLMLKVIYASIGSNDFITASKLSSQLHPMDPKNPYDAHASYYFAKAALSQATGKSGEAEEDIQTARTIYGITITNRYLKTYLEVFASSDKDIGSPATTNAAPVKPQP